MLFRSGKQVQTDMADEWFVITWQAGDLLHSQGPRTIPFHELVLLTLVGLSLACYMYNVCNTPDLLGY